MNTTAFTLDSLDIGAKCSTTLTILEQNAMFCVPIRYLFETSEANSNVWHMLNKVANGDINKRLLIEEALGSTLYPYLGSIQPLSFWFLGSGSEGKSVILSFFQNTLGLHNVASMDLLQTTGTFGYQPLIGKMAMINADISTQMNKEANVFKAISASDIVLVNRKGETAINVRMNATPIFGANDFPQIYDATSSIGVIRRMTFIKMTRKFKSTDSDYNPYLVEELEEEKAYEYMLQLGLKALQRLITNRFIPTETEDKTETLADFTRETDNVYAFLHDIQENELSFLMISGEERRQTSTQWYKTYQHWAEDTGSKSLNQRNFSKKMKLHFDNFGFKTTKSKGITYWTMKINKTEAEISPINELLQRNR